MQALRRVIAWRGPKRELRCDQGTNFVRAENELRKSFQETGDERIKAELLKHNIDWIRNPAMASNFGDAWERQIRSVPNTTAALMKQHGHSLDDESLKTVLRCKQSPSYYRILKWPTVSLVTNAKYTSHRQDQTYSSCSREVSIGVAIGSVLSLPINKLVLLLNSSEDRPGIPDEEPKDHLWIRNMICKYLIKIRTWNT